MAKLEIIPHKKYIFNADLVRALAIMGVIGIHLLSPIYARPDFFNGTLWWMSFLLNGVFRTSVPLFIMLSGYLVLGRNISYQENIRKTFHRIVVPLLSFYVIYHLYSWYVALERGEPYYFIDVLANLTKNTYSYLYFLVVLTYLYLLVPLFAPLFTLKDRKIPAYVIAFFFTNAILVTFFRYLTLREGEVLHTFSLWTVWVGYFLFGYWYRWAVPKWKTKTLVSVLGVSFLATIALAYLNLYWHIHGHDWFYIGGQTYAEEYLSVGVVAMSANLFVLLMRLRLPELLAESRLFLKGVKWLAGISFSLYLIHPMVIDYLHKFAGVAADSPSMPNLVVYLFLSGTLTLVISVLLSMIVMKTPGLRRIVGLR